MNNITQMYYSISQNPFCFVVILLDLDLFNSSFLNGFNVFYILLWFYIVILLSRTTGELYNKLSPLHKFLRRNLILYFFLKANNSIFMPEFLSNSSFEI